MLKGELYRPLVLSGRSLYNSYCMGIVDIDNNSDIKTNSIQVLFSGSIHNFSEGYKGYLFEDSIIPNDIKGYLHRFYIPYLSSVNNANTLVNKDVLEIISSNNIAKVLFRANSGDNALVVTNQCNCNCIMCPEPTAVRQCDIIIPLDKIMTLISLIDSKISNLCITGGEPTILKEKLFAILDACKNRFVNTDFTLLTNARMFSYLSYVKKFNLHKPNYMILGVPIYGDCPDIHDVVTNTSGSFIQTIAGLKNLLNTGNRIELRIVVSRLNYLNLLNLSNFIIKNFPNILRVSIMALEMLGNAVVNRENVWIGFDDIKEVVKRTAINLISNGIETYLFNFPLCFVDESLWSISLKSISDYKVRFFDKCESCRAKAKCGGFFNSRINQKEIRVKPIM